MRRNPYVERLLEGFAFLAARVQLRLDAEFPRFARSIFLRTLLPHYVSPTPSIVVAQFQPDPREGSLAAGYTIPRQTPLRGLAPKGEATACEFRTANDVSLWPLEIVAAEYLSRDSAGMELPAVAGLRAVLRLRLKATAGLASSQIAIDKLPLFLHGGGESPMRMYEQLLANSLGVMIRPPQIPGS